MPGISMHVVDVVRDGPPTDTVVSVLGTAMFRFAFVAPDERVRLPASQALAVRLPHPSGQAG